MKIITTTYENQIIKTTEQEIALIKEDKVESQVINLYPQVQFQEILGFGGAFTEAAGYTLAAMNEQVRKEIMEAYFGENGLNYTLCRLHMDSCDFSLDNYSAVNDPNDTDLETFSLERDHKYILPCVKTALEISRKPIRFMMSPWSPPAFMKSNGQKNMGGKLLKEYYPLWAKYMAKYVKAYRDMGIDVIQLTVQNEPNATLPWDTCVYTGNEEMVFVRDHLGPAMEEAGLTDTEIFIWDHNKERIFDRAEEVLNDKNADKYIKGVAFHWYSGDHFEAVDLVSRLYPDKCLIQSEGAYEIGTDQLIQAQGIAHHMIGNFNAGMHANIDWNLVLDQYGGPNHVGNFGVQAIMCNTEEGTYEKRLAYTYTGHFSRYIMPGARRIGFSRYSDQLEVSAFLNVDGTIAAVILNRTEKDILYNVRISSHSAEKLVSPKQSITTLLVNKQQMPNERGLQQD